MRTHLKTVGNNRANLSKKEGFTLVELLVASTVGSLVVAMVATVLAQVVFGWQSNSGRMQSEVDARVALELIADDLRSIVVRDDGTEWLRVIPEDDIGPAGTTAKNTPWIMFTAEPNDPDRLSAGDTGALSYRIAYRDPFDGDRPLFALYRKVLSPVDSLDALGERDLAGGLWAAREPETYAIESLVAAHVVGLEIVFWLQNGDGTLHAVGTDHTIRAGGSLYADPPVLGLVDAKPRYADISITTVDVHALEWGGATFNEHVRRHGRTFTTRVDFSARVR